MEKGGVLKIKGNKRNEEGERGRESKREIREKKKEFKRALEIEIEEGSRQSETVMKRKKGFKEVV